MVNHHFVTPEVYDRGIYPVDPTQFNTNIKALFSNGWLPISLNDLSKPCFLGEEENYFLLTFDDGLLCHYETVGPLLDAHGIEGIFFIPTCILVGEPATTHQLQYIRSKTPDPELSDWLFRRFPDVARIPLDEQALATQYPYDDTDAARLKFLLNFALPSKVHDSIIGDLFSEFGGDNKFFSETYMNQGQIGALAKLHEIGSHGHSHKPLSSLTNEELRSELQMSKVMLEEVIRKKVDAISFPYGSLSAVSTDVCIGAADAGYRFGFSMIRGRNALTTVEQNPLAIKRINVNELGKWMKV